MGTLGRAVLVGAWYLALTIAAFLAVGVELDRQARFNQRLAESVPKPFQADALAGLTKLAFERNDSVLGEALARKLVERRPITAEALSLYAEGLLANGKEEEGAAVLQVAAARGWRDRFVQRVVILSALQQGTPEIAVQRVIGLWRIGERAEWLKKLTQSTLEAPGGVSAFEANLLEHDRYLGTDFLAWAAAKLPLVVVDRLARRIAANRSEFDCKIFSDKADQLVGGGISQPVMAVWNALCSPANRSSVNDLTFKTEDVLPAPFDWRYPDSPGVDAQLRNERGEVVLSYTSSDPLVRVIARRYLALRSGHYLLEMGASAVPPGVKVSVSCVVGPPSKGEITLDAVARRRWSFVVPSGCSVQKLSIAARSGSGEIKRLEIRSSVDHTPGPEQPGEPAAPI